MAEESIVPVSFIMSRAMSFEYSYGSTSYESQRLRLMPLIALTEANRLGEMYVYSFVAFRLACSISVLGPGRPPLTMWWFAWV